MLGRIIAEREAEGWTDDRLVPLVAGLAELQPWVDQWHAELHPTYGLSLAADQRGALPGGPLSSATRVSNSLPG